MSAPAGGSSREQTTTSPPARVTVELGERAYPVVIGRGLLDELTEHLSLPADATRALIVTQPPIPDGYVEAVAGSIQGAGLRVARSEVPDGEQAKQVGVLEGLYHECAEMALGRRDLVVAVGGGTVGDLAGFLAATYNRGVPVLQVPTTLLAQVDAAIGGKTGVNLPQGKNLVGAFHQPLGVVADVDTLATLEPRLLIEGLGEVVKYGLIADPVILDLLEAAPEPQVTDHELLAELVTRSARVKAEIVAADETEQGRRAHLNLGHTYGHVAEILTGDRELLHGEAVGVGINVALRLGVALGVTPPAVLDRAVDLLDRVGLPAAPPALDADRAWTTMERDKKARRGRVRFVLLEELTRPVLREVGREEVEAAVEAAADQPAPTGED